MAFSQADIILDASASIAVERYLALDGENVLVLEEKEILIRLPLHISKEL